jgi:hypothetical protein
MCRGIVRLHFSLYLFLLSLSLSILDNRQIFTHTCQLSTTWLNKETAVALTDYRTLTAIKR